MTTHRSVKGLGIQSMAAVVLACLLVGGGAPTLANSTRSCQDGSCSPPWEDWDYWRLIFTDPPWNSS